MNKELLNEIADFLEDCREFLNDCDDGLAGEVGMKDKISGRIYKGANEISTACRMARELARKAD